MAKVYFSLGSNVGDCLAHLEFGIRALEAAVGRICHRSPTYRTAPFDAPPQDDFYNLVIECETQLPPETILNRTKAIERDAGRGVEVTRHPRTLDIDILLYGGEIVDAPGLAVPHPRMEERAFVLIPLAEIAPDLVLPSGKSIRQLLADPHIASQRVERVSDAEL